MKISSSGSSLKQKKYAQDVFSANGRTKKEIALNAGYTLNAAKSVTSKIENTKGYKNAMMEILRESDNVVLNIFGEFRSRGFQDFSNKDLVAAVTAISTAWEKFNNRGKSEDGPQSANKLRTIILQQVENQTIQQKEEPKIVEVAPVETNEYQGF